MNSKKYLSGAVAALTGISMLLVAVPAFAAAPTPPTGGWQQGSGTHGGGPGGMRGGPGMARPAAFGTVSAINGTTLTVTGKQGFGTSSASVTYSVDASNATVFKNNATSSLSAIAAGDTVIIQGTVSGTSITATSIHDGVMMGGRMGPGGQGSFGGKTGTSTSPIQGNGQPVVAGTVSTVSGSILTITNKSNQTYTVDATNAKIVEGQNTISVSSIATGDSVLVQGTINGNSVVATSVIDQTNATAGQKPHMGFFGGIGQFFMHIFGF